jgi:predicted DNA binding CopG/RHH family protein
MMKLINFKVSEQDADFIKKFANDRGLNLSKYIRNMLLNDIKSKQTKN